MSSLTVSDAPLRLLVPVDGSPLADEAIGYAAALAKPDDEVWLIHVAPVPLPESRHDLDSTVSRAFFAVGGGADGTAVQESRITEQDQTRAERDARLVTTASAERWKTVLPHARERVAFGDPAEEITKAAAEIGADLIVMASHGRGALGRWRYGSVADRVARVSPTPALIIRPHDDETISGSEIRRFVVALDGSDVAPQALAVVRRLAVHGGIPVHLIRVIITDLLDLKDFSTVEKATQHATEILEESAADLIAAGLTVTVGVEVGDPFERITASLRPGDVLALASHGRSGITRWLLGSMAEKLIRMAPAPTLVVRAAAEKAAPAA